MEEQRKETCLEGMKEIVTSVAKHLMAHAAGFVFSSHPLILNNALSFGQGECRRFVLGQRIIYPSRSWADETKALGFAFYTPIGM